MKIAFGTSVAGIISAITFKLVAAFFTKETVENREVTPTDIYNVLKKISEDTNKNGTASIEALSELRSVISSDKDTSLLTQVQKLRTTVDDGQKELIKEFKDFAEHMVENNQKAIIEALENVIKDFNEKLTEQFGENFKQLNEAVEKLVDWQDRYKEILEEYDRKISNTVEGLENSERALLSVKGVLRKNP
jgi:DNA anti-recombination protein RmuC